MNESRMPAWISGALIVIVAMIFLGAFVLAGLKVVNATWTSVDERQEKSAAERPVRAEVTANRIGEIAENLQEGFTAVAQDIPSTEDAATRTMLLTTRWGAVNIAVPEGLAVNYGENDDKGNEIFVEVWWVDYPEEGTFYLGYPNQLPGVWSDDEAKFPAGIAVKRDPVLSIRTGFEKGDASR